MNLIKAKITASETTTWLRPFCSRINVAGSVRRQAPNPGDIEIVCLPLMTAEENLFGEKGAPERSHDFIAAVKALGRIEKGEPATGRYIQITLPGQIQLDLFIPQPHDYFRQYAIRTGSADYARRQIAAAWTKKGWVGTPDGLRIKTQCKQKQNPGKATTYTCTISNPTLPPAWESEEEFFAWLGVEYIKPELRI